MQQALRELRERYIALLGQQNYDSARVLLRLPNLNGKDRRLIKGTATRALTITCRKRHGRDCSARWAREQKRRLRAALTQAGEHEYIVPLREVLGTF